MIDSEILPTIPSQRIKLRWLIDEDVLSLYSIFSSPEAMKYWSSPPIKNINQARVLLNSIHTSFQEKTFFQWGISHINENKIIGTCTLLNYDHQNRRAEVGYILAYDYWGQGFMTEALTALFNYAFNNIGLHRIEADIDPRNSNSLKILERLGFQQEGLLRERWLVGEEVQNSLILGLLRHEWVSKAGTG